MIVSFFHITVPPERAEAFERTWCERAGTVDQMPGFQGMEVLRDSQKPGTYIVLTRWDAKEHFEAWANSPEFVAAHARPHASAGSPGGPTGGGIEFFEVVPNAPIAR